MAKKPGSARVFLNLAYAGSGLLGVASMFAFLTGGEGARLDHGRTGAQAILSDALARHPAIIVSSLFINTLTLLLPLSILQIYDRVIPSASIDTLVVLASVLIVAAFLDTILRTLRANLISWESAKFDHQVGIDLIGRLLGREEREFEKEPPGNHLDRLQAADEVRDFYSGQTLLTLLDIPFVALFFILIGIIGGFLVIVPMVLAALLGLLALGAGDVQRPLAKQRADHGDRVSNFLIEVLTGIHSVKSMAMEAAMLRRYERLQENGATLTYRTIKLNNLLQAYGSLIANGSLAGVAAVGSLMVMSNNLSLGGLAACTLLTGRAVQPILRGLSLWNQIQTVDLARGKLVETYAWPDIGTLNQPSVRAPKDGSIEAKGVTYRYAPDLAPVLNDINLSVPAGALVAITGPDEGGKTTFAKIITGELQPEAGSISIGGLLLNDENRQAIRQAVGYVPPEPALFDGTILENLACFEVGEKLDAARGAARLINLEPDIDRLPDGYDSPINARTKSALPPGLVERIAIARALARRPLVLVFDEANATFDRKNEEGFQETLAKLKGRLTTIVITYRPSLIKMADVVVDLSPPPAGPGSEEKSHDHVDDRQAAKSA